MSMFNPFQMLPYMMQGFNGGQGNQNPFGGNTGGDFGNAQNANSQAGQGFNPFGGGSPFGQNSNSNSFGQGFNPFGQGMNFMNMFNNMNRNQQPPPQQQQQQQPPPQQQQQQQTTKTNRVEYPFTAIDDVITDKIRLMLILLYKK